MWVGYPSAIYSTLFRKKMSALNFLTQRNASIFAMFMKKENSSSLFVDIDQGIHKINLKVVQNEEQKKTMWVFFFNKYGKF